MSALEQRPRFQNLLPWPPEEVKARLNEALTDAQAPVTGSVSGNHVFLKIPKDQRHVWTPQMDLELLSEGEEQTLVNALIGPSPSVWTRFVFIYAFAGFMMLFGIITGVPQWILDKTPIGLFVAGGGVVLALIGYLFATSGKQLARMQTEVLRGFWLNLVQEHALPMEVQKQV